MIRLTLDAFLGSLHTIGMPNVVSSVLIFVCAGNIFEHGNPVVSNKYENVETNKTIIVIIAINST